jgi:hypothetical protein
LKKQKYWSENERNALKVKGKPVPYKNKAPKLKIDYPMTAKICRSMSLNLSYDDAMRFNDSADLGLSIQAAVL